MRGTVVFSRVVDDPGTALSAALERELDGTAVLAPADTVLFDGDDAGVLELTDGVPVAARHEGSGRAGADAVAALAGRGPYRVTLRAADGDAPAGGAATGAGRDAAIAPALPAELLADDPALADRTRAVADDEAGTAPLESGESTDALAAFLANDEKIAAIQERARAEAERRAAEWGLDELATDERGGAEDSVAMGGTEAPVDATRREE